MAHFRLPSRFRAPPELLPFGLPSLRYCVRFFLFPLCCLGAPGCIPPSLTPAVPNRSYAITGFVEEFPLPDALPVHCLALGLNISVWPGFLDHFFFSFSCHSLQKSAFAGVTKFGPCSILGLS